MSKQRSEGSKSQADVWLCLRFPCLALNCAGIRIKDQKTPAAIIEQQTIVQANLSAQASGVKVKHAVEYARMLCSDLLILERQPALEKDKLQSLCAWAYRYTSHISIYDDHTLLLEVGRSLAFFKGISSMQNLIMADLERFNIDVKHGASHTPKAACLLSFNQDKQWQLTGHKNKLIRSRLGHLAIPEKTVTQLHSCGFELLHDINRIPKQQLGARFGKPFILYLEQLMGEVADPQDLHCNPETFKANIDFAEPIYNRAWIQQQIDRLLNELVIFANSHQLICRSFTWRFFNEKNRLSNSITIRLNMSSLKLNNLRELTELKLSTLSLKWAFSSIELSSEELISKHFFHQDLFDPKADQEEFNQLIDKLSSRLGNSAIYAIDTADEHLPELANKSCYLAAQKTLSYKKVNVINSDKPTIKSTIIESTLEQDEPIWLLRQPQKLNKKDGQPEHDGELKFIHGPNRISSHWWQTLQSRDYYIAKQKSGRLLWVYYERCQQDWYLQGLYG